MSLKSLSEGNTLLGQPTNKQRLRQLQKAGRKGFYRKSLDRIRKVSLCLDLVTDWDDWLDFKWWSRAFRSILPPPALNIDEWADIYRRIASEAAAEPGDWQTEKMPCMRAIMRKCSPSDPAHTVVVVKPAQAGGTEACVLNVIGFTIDINPRSILVVFPTIELAESFSRERLDPMIAICPTLKDKVSDIGQGTRGNQPNSTVRRKRYPGGFANLVGANSTSGLSSRPVPVVIMDEVDRCLNNAGREGNPTKLLATRATTFFDRKEIYLSSPARLEDETGILQMYADSNQQELQVSCPECGAYQVLPWENFDIETATCSCSDCKKYFAQWQWQSTPQRWLERNPGHTTEGFMVGWFVSPWVDWKEVLAKEWVEAKRLEDMGDGSLMRVFVNTRLAQAYKKLGKRIEINLYGQRREVYPCHERHVELPDEVKVVTAAVDVQDSMLVYEIIGWGIGRESWGIECGDLQGDPGLPEVWTKLDAFVFARILHWSDGQITRPRIIFIDSGGHKTTEVYKYCKARHPRVFAIKGKDGLGTGIITASKRRQSAIGNWLVRVGSDTLKDEFHTRIKLDKPGPGYCHFPMLPGNRDTCGYDSEYFKQLVCEQRVLKFDKQGFAQYEWAKNRTDANDYLMCRCYARAALEYLKISIDTMERDTLSIPKDRIRSLEIATDKIVSSVEVPTYQEYKPQYGKRNVSDVARPRQQETYKAAGPTYGAGGRSF